MVNFAKLFNYRWPAQTQGEIEKKPWLAHCAERSNRRDNSGFIRSQFLRARLGTLLVVIGVMFLLIKPVQADIKIKHECFLMHNSANLNIDIKGEINQSDVNALQRKLDILTGKQLPKDLSDTSKLPPKALSNSEILDLIAKSYARSSTTEDQGYGCNAKSVYVSATLDSIGGSVDAAIRFGEIIRSAKGKVTVKAGAICYSSCVLVLAAASRRHIESKAKIGIHRPYFRNRLSVSDESMEETYRKLTVRIENFLTSSGVRPQLAWEMMRVPPEQVRVLTRAELDDYGLGTNNIAVQEADAMHEAEKYGVSRQELVRRRQNVSRICGPAPCQDRANVKACLMWAFCEDTVLKEP